VIGPSPATRSKEVPLTCLRNSQGVYGRSEGFLTTGGSSDTTCPGQITRSFNSKDPTGKSSNTTSIAIAPTGSSSLDGASANNTNNGGRIGAIVGGTVAAVVLLGLLLFILFRRKKGHGKDHGGMEFWEKHESNLDYITAPVPFIHSAPGGSVNQTSVPSTSLTPPYYTNPTSTSEHTGFSSENMSAASRKAASAAQERGIQTSMDGGVIVHQHVDAVGVVELPPAYRDASNH
jgi:hypothetical protein